MAKVPPPPRKGLPPSPDSIIGTLHAPERVEHEPLNFKVPRAFRREFKTYAAQQGKSMSQVLQEAFALYKGAGE